MTDKNVGKKTKSQIDKMSFQNSQTKPKFIIAQKQNFAKYFG